MVTNLKRVIISPPMPAEVNPGESSGADGLDHLEVVESEVPLDGDVVVLADDVGGVGCAGIVATVLLGSVHQDKDRCRLACFLD